MKNVRSVEPTSSIVGQTWSARLNTVTYDSVWKWNSCVSCIQSVLCTCINHAGCRIPTQWTRFVGQSVDFAAQLRLESARWNWSGRRRSLCAEHPEARQSLHAAGICYNTRCVDRLQVTIIHNDMYIRHAFCHASWIIMSKTYIGLYVYTSDIFVQQFILVIVIIQFRSNHVSFSLVLVL